MEDKPLDQYTWIELCHELKRCKDLKLMNRATEVDALLKRMESMVPRNTSGDGNYASDLTVIFPM